MCRVLFWKASIAVIVVSDFYLNFFNVVSETQAWRLVVADAQTSAKQRSKGDNSRGVSVFLRCLHSLVASICT